MIVRSYISKKLDRSLSTISGLYNFSLFQYHFSRIYSIDFLETIWFLWWIFRLTSPCLWRLVTAQSRNFYYIFVAFDLRAPCHVVEWIADWPGLKGFVGTWKRLTCSGIWCCFDPCRTRFCSFTALSWMFSWLRDTGTWWMTVWNNKRLREPSVIECSARVVVAFNIWETNDDSARGGLID